METKRSDFSRNKRRFLGRGMLMIVFSLGITAGVMAQHGHVGYSAIRVYPRAYVGVGFGYGPYLPYYGFYNPWGYPYPPYYYGHGAMPSRLSLQIDEIKNDYEARIQDVKADTSLSRKDRRQKINQLKHDRDAAIIQAKRDFYYNSHRNYNSPQQPDGNGQQPAPQNNNQKPSKENNDPQSEKSGSDSGNNGASDQTYGGNGSD